jgi:hypothetical protein
MDEDGRSSCQALVGRFLQGPTRCRVTPCSGLWDGHGPSQRQAGKPSSRGGRRDPCGPSEPGRRGDPVNGGTHGRGWQVFMPGLGRSAPAGWPTRCRVTPCSGLWDGHGPSQRQAGKPSSRGGRRDPCGPSEPGRRGDLVNGGMRGRGWRAFMPEPRSSVPAGWPTHVTPGRHRLTRLPRAPGHEAATRPWRSGPSQ